MHKKKEFDTRNDRHRESQTILEAKQQVADRNHEVEKVTKRNEELQLRCDELVASCESERKAR